MTVTPEQLALYALGLFGLWVTPGPVWLAVIARSLSGGARAGLAVAMGVAVGDVIWPTAAILSVAWLAGQVGEVLSVLRWVAAAMFIGMGIMVIRGARAPVAELPTARGLTGFAAGLVSVIGNPKALVFYMGLLPGFFDVGHLTGADIAVIAAVSPTVPLAGNAVLALAVAAARERLTTPERMFRLNLFAGCLLILVGIVIPLT